MIIKCVGIAMLSLCICAVLRTAMPSLIPFVGGASGLVMVIICLDQSKGSIGYYYDLCVNSGYGDYYKVMLKGLGVAYIANIGCDLCKDCGEVQLASRIEFSAKIEILVISLPLVKNLIELSESIMIS